MKYLIGGLEHFLIFPYIGNVIIPTDFHIFQGVGQPTASISYIKFHEIPSGYVG